MYYIWKQAHRPKWDRGGQCDGRYIPSYSSTYSINVYSKHLKLRSQRFGSYEEQKVS